MVDYNNFAKTFSVSRENMKWEEIEYFLWNYDLTDKSILDVWCGNGRFLSAVKSKNINFSSYLGLDLSAWLLEEAAKLHPENEFLNLNMLDLDKLNKKEDFICFWRKWKLSESQSLIGWVFEFSEKILKFNTFKFDAIFFIASFHHLQKLEDRIEVLKNLKNLLSQDWKIFFTNWNLIGQERYKKSEITDSLNEFWSIDFDIKIWEFTRYYHGFTISELEYLFKEAWLEVIENRVFDNERNIISIVK